jgi:hypothetical protein
MSDSTEEALNKFYSAADSGPGSADPDMYSALAGSSNVLMTPHGHCIISYDFKKEKKLFGTSRGDLRIGGVAKDGRRFFLVTIQKKFVFEGYVGLQSFQGLPVASMTGTDIPNFVMQATDQIIAGLDTGNFPTITHRPLRGLDGHPDQ